MKFTVIARMKSGETRPVSYETRRDGAQLALTVRKESLPSEMVHLDIRCDALTAPLGSEGYIAVSAAPGVGDLLCDFSPKAPGERLFEWPLLPLFGMKNEVGCVAAMTVGGGLEVSHVVDVDEGSIEVFARFAPVKPMTEDIEMIFRTLLGNSANYSGMARAYRERQLASGRVRPLAERMEDSPELRHAMESIYVRIRQGWKPVPSPVPEQTIENEPPMRVAVTFDRAAELMDEFKRQGIDDADFCLVGWNQKGHDGRYPQLFPVEEQLGGEERLRALIQHANELGYSINCHTNSTDSYSIADCFSEDELIQKSDGSLSMNGEGWSAGNMYHLCAEPALRRAEADLPKVAALGFRGLHYIDVISVVWPRDCFHPEHPMNKRETAQRWLDILRTAKRTFGGISSEGCFDFAMPELDFGLYQGFNLLGELPEVAQRRVPLWSLVYHGIVMSNPSAETVNYPVKGWRERLKCYEYGGRPAMYYYSRFVGEGRNNWMGEDDLLCGDENELVRGVCAVRRAYDEYKVLRHLQTEFMESHERIVPDVIEVRYSGGERMIFNYSEEDFELEGRLVPAHDYRLLPKEAV